jgi:hypothetical protein
MPVLKLDAKARIGQDLGHKTLERDQFFLGHCVHLAWG